MANASSQTLPPRVFITHQSNAASQTSPIVVNKLNTEVSVRPEDVSRKQPITTVVVPQSVSVNHEQSLTSIGTITEQHHHQHQQMQLTPSPSSNILTCAGTSSSSGVGTTVISQQPAMTTKV